MRCLHPKRRVSQPFGIAVSDSALARTSSGAAMFLSVCMKVRAAGRRGPTHPRFFAGAGCGLQLIWGIPEELRRERAKLGSLTRCALGGGLSSRRCQAGAGRGRAAGHLPLAARFRPAFFSSANLSTSPG